MQVSNLQYYTDLDFNDYLKMEGFSYSSLKRHENGTDIIPSQGMMLGTRVHNYILEPHKYDDVDRHIVVPIASDLRKYLGAAINHLEKEVAFTAILEHQGMFLQYKGRADLIYKGKLIVDLKILSGKLQYAIERFGYDKQLSGYALASGCKNALILSYNKAKKRDNLESFMVKPNEDWWNYMIVKYGTPI